MIKKNIIANLLGRAWSVIVNLVCVPLYISILGIESFGLIGFYSVLVASIYILEFGLGATITRSMAQEHRSLEEKDSVRDLARTMEVLFWGISVMVSLVLIIVVSIGNQTWVNTETISPQKLTAALILMCVSVLFQFPASFYSSGLVGMERQVKQNLLNSTFSVLRNVGGILLLLYAKNDVLVFFGWQLLTNIIQLICFAYFFWKNIVSGSRWPKFDFYQFKKVWPFTVGVGLTGFITFFLSQLDKLIISRIMPMSSFGYYNVANQISTATTTGSSAIFVAYLPRMTRLKSIGENERLKIAFHQGCQVVALVVIPASCIIMFFAHDLIQIWTRNPEIANMSSTIVVLLVAGSLFNSLSGMAYDLTLAFGWSRFGFYQNLVAVVLIVPLLIVLIRSYGMVGAGIAWLALNIGYFLISVPIVLKRLMKGELYHWLAVDSLRPLLICVFISFVARLAIDQALDEWVLIVVLFFVWLIATLITTLALPAIRPYLFSILKKYRYSVHGKQ